MSGQLRTVALTLARIANDLRLMGSGPRTGLAEIRLPDLQPGSSIMPGKVNPVIPEAVYQVAAQVVGNDAAVAFGATAGAFELNTATPMICWSRWPSSPPPPACSPTAAWPASRPTSTSAGPTPSPPPALATALNAHIGYEQSSAVVRQAAAEGRTIREIVVERGLPGQDQVDVVLDVEAMTYGGVL